VTRPVHTGSRARRLKGKGGSLRQCSPTQTLSRSLRQRLAHMKRVPRVKTLRLALGVTQEEFAPRYQIPIGTLGDWELGRSEPDKPARAYLKVVARDPEGVRRVLEWKWGSTEQRAG
jgi:DNA-binding transcriptional regulator YiaG